LKKGGGRPLFLLRERSVLLIISTKGKENNFLEKRGLSVPLAAGEGNGGKDRKSSSSSCIVGGRRFISS